MVKTHGEGSFLDSNKSFFYDKSENELRPNNLNDFIGQEHLKDNLRIFIKASLKRQEALDHVFLSGPPGLGKTTLASIIAFEMNTTIKVTSAPALDKPKDIVGILTTLDERGILFIDEMHRLKPIIEEMLYIAMEDYEIDWVIGQGPSARTIRIPVPRFTLIGATTKPGRVTPPLYARFGIISRFEFYLEQDLVNIINRNSEILGIKIEKEAALILAKSSRGTPRVTNRLLRRMRDFVQVRNQKLLTREIINESLALLKIDSEGLDEQDRNILKNLILKFKGGPVGVETLAISVGETADSLEDFYEPYLIQKGFIERTNRGRKAMNLAYKHLNLKKEIMENFNGNQRILF